MNNNLYKFRFLSFLFFGQAPLQRIAIGTDQSGSTLVVAVVGLSIGSEEGRGSTDGARQDVYQLDLEKERAATGDASVGSSLLSVGLFGRDSEHGGFALMHVEDALAPSGDHLGQGELDGFSAERRIEDGSVREGSVVVDLDDASSGGVGTLAWAIRSVFQNVDADSRIQVDDALGFGHVLEHLSAPELEFFSEGIAVFVFVY